MRGACSADNPSSSDEVTGTVARAQHPVTCHPMGGPWWRRIPVAWPRSDANMELRTLPSSNLPHSSRSILDQRSGTPIGRNIPCFFTRYNGLLAFHLCVSPIKAMNFPLRSYFFSPLDAKTNDSEWSHLPILSSLPHAP